MAQPETNSSPAFMSAFYNVLGAVPSDTYENSHAELAPIVRDLALGTVVQGPVDPTGKTWNVDYDGQFNLAVTRVSMRDHNNPDVQVVGYALNVSDAKGSPVLEARVYDHHDTARKEVTHEFQLQTLARGGAPARALHDSFFKPLAATYEGKFKQISAPA